MGGGGRRPICRSEDLWSRSHGQTWTRPGPDVVMDRGRQGLLSAAVGRMSSDTAPCGTIRPSPTQPGGKSKRAKEGHFEATSCPIRDDWAHALPTVPRTLRVDRCHVHVRMHVCTGATPVCMGVHAYTCACDTTQHVHTHTMGSVLVRPHCRAVLRHGTTGSEVTTQPAHMHTCACMRVLVIGVEEASEIVVRNTF